MISANESKNQNNNFSNAHASESNMKITIDEDQKDLPLSFKLRHMSLEWILSSTSHGLPSVFRVDQIYLKIMWLICFLGSTGGCAYIVINYVISYLTYPVNVSTTIETETPINFPAITFCNLNPFSGSTAKGFVMDILTTYNLSYTIGTVTTLSGSTAISLANYVYTILKTEAASNPKINSTQRQNLGFTLNDMIISCSFNGNEKDCTANDFSFFQSYDYGNCYTFNSGTYANGSSSTIKTISAAGSGKGLEIELFSGDPNDELFTYKRGFYVVVHNQSYSPIFDNEGVHVGVGMQTNIGIDRTFYYKMPDPYSSCISDTTSNTSSTASLYQIVLNELGEKNYRQKYCYKLCYQQNVISKCSCYDPAYSSPSYSEGKRILPCHDSSDTTCMKNARIDFDASNLKTLCDSDCPQECNAVWYKTIISTATYPTDRYLNWLLLQPSLTQKYSTNKTSLSTQVTESLAKINVFYNEISYTAMTESAVTTWDALLGNIGGQLGLFIGISFLSLVECIEFLLELIRIIFLHRQTNKVKNNAISHKA